MLSIHHFGKIPKSWHLRPSVFFSTALSKRSQDKTEFKWLWKLNEAESDFHKANLSGTRIGGVAMTFNTAKPLSADDFRKAFGYLERKLPHLRTHIRTRGNSFWFCQSSDFKPAFQVVEDVSDTREVIQKMVRNLGQNPETTSWDAGVFFHNEDAVCHIPEIKATHPYQYTFLSSLFHALLDGAGGTHFLRSIFKILSDITEGKAISEKPFASFYEEKEIPALLNHIKHRLVEDAVFFKSVKETMPLADYIPLIFQAFPQPKPAITTTKHLTGIIEPKPFSYIKLRCKREGITLNSFIVAVINIALMELVREKGITADSYTISPCVVTDNRRYMKKSAEPFLGPCISSLSFRSTVDANAMGEFWSYCKTLNGNIHSSIKERLPLHQGALSMLISREQSYDYKYNLRPILNDYVLTNMGDVNVIVPRSNLLKLTNLEMMGFIQNSFHSNLHQIMSFNHRLYYTLNYPTNCLSDETAQLFLDKIFSIFRYIGKTSNL